MFWGFSKFQSPGAGVAPCPNMGAGNWKFLKLMDENNRVTAPYAGRENARGAKMHVARKNVPNLPITSPNINF